MKYKYELHCHTAETSECAAALAKDTVEFYNFYLAYDPTHYYPTPAVEEEDPSYTIEDKDFVNDDGMLAIYRSCELDPLRRLNIAAA